jgi:hypothetical protein
MKALPTYIKWFSAENVTIFRQEACSLHFFAEFDLPFFNICVILVKQLKDVVDINWQRFH